MTQVTQQIQELRSKGYRVFITHQRPVYGSEKRFNLKEIKNHHYTPYPKGGTTVCEILDGDKLIARGESKCADVDNFSRKIGCLISLGRCVKNLEQ